MAVIGRTQPCARKCLIYSFFNSIRHFFEWWLWPKAARFGLFGDRQQSADRWFLSMAVNRPLVGELTPVTLLVYNSRLPSHSLGQLVSFSQKWAGGSGPVGKRTDVLASKNRPHCCIWLCGWEFGSQKKNGKIKSSPIHWTSAPPAEGSFLWLLKCHDSKVQQMKKLSRAYQPRGQLSRLGKLIK